jgi:valyl-tRNA synthetase
LDNLRFSEAYDRLYHFIWDDFADWYIEASKAAPNKALLAYLLEQVLVLAHPFAPFVTETIWQTLAWEKDSILASRTLEKIIASDKRRARDFEDLKIIIAEVRDMTRALKVSGATLYHNNNEFLHENAAMIKHLARLKGVVGTKDHGEGLYLTTSSYRSWLDIDPVKAKAYAKELAGKMSRQKDTIEQLESRLKNRNYIQNAPREVIDQTKQQLMAAQELLASIETEQQRFRG